MNAVQEARLKLESWLNIEDEYMKYADRTKYLQSDRCWLATQIRTILESMPTGKEADAVANAKLYDEAWRHGIAKLNRIAENVAGTKEFQIDTMKGFVGNLVFPVEWTKDDLAAIELAGRDAAAESRPYLASALRIIEHKIVVALSRA